ncbi:MAG: molecular chaperone DnaJ [Cellvibrionales bacterium TMED49]|nr:molecular chaperone DnaJ [Porticoccaceae bacterium]MAH74153.1 molecular chaperone DnaJ [Porticoccaceae bacterium]OUU35238.1 MAG: molecular chaperone DnaJ [Cellvibrionales bacterium TMED49]OUU36994.1 MAG: molecular chaperone DnaJ [Cellvibrionales bacterium TMED49]|tara:strand:+ start:77 stop:778 length:702 start_codon:yes stop_codon:yes gene_type:complete
MIKVLFLLGGILAIWRWRGFLLKLPSEKRNSFLWKSVFFVVFLGSVGLVAMGKLHWIGAGLAALVPMIKVIISMGLRALPFLQIFRGFRSSPSHIRTEYIDAEINFYTKIMDGEVLSGDYGGRKLSTLTNDELNSLSDWLKRKDRESFILLNTYMMKMGKSAGSKNFSQDQTNNSFSQMSKKDALQILGLNESTTNDEIVKAHKRLVQRLHPDRGGSDYLAAKINAAKDRLLG